MTRSALTYAWTIIALGTLILIGAACLWQPANATAFGVCLALALFASTLKLKLPELTETLSPGFVFLLVSVATLSWPETVVIAAASGFIQSRWRPQTPPTRLQTAFAGATLAIAGGLTYGVTWSLAALRGPDTLALTLGVAALVLLVSNTLIVATILCLIKEAPFHTVWRSVHRRAVPYYLAGGVIANVWARADLTAPAGFALLAAISVYLLSLCIREFAVPLCERR